MKSTQGRFRYNINRILNGKKEEGEGLIVFWLQLLRSILESFWNSRV